MAKPTIRRKTVNDFKAMIFGGVFFIAVLFGATILFGSWYTIDEGERGVVLRNGEYRETSDPGLHFKWPIIDDVVKLSVRTEKEVYSMDSYSQDQQLATLIVSVNYVLNPAEVGTVYSTYGSTEGVVLRLLTPRVNQEAKIVFGRFTAASAIRERGRMNTEVQQAIANSIAAAEPSVLIDSVQIEDVKFSPEYEDSIEQRMLAEVAVTTATQNLEREQVLAEIVNTQTDAEAYKRRELGQAEADAIAARGQALKDNPDLVELVQAERWNGILPTTMVPSGALPVIGLK
jgi:regulator of protease activity HflC (stomatin/prohibitin superfamily)